MKKKPINKPIVQVYLASITRGNNKKTVTHWRCEVIGFPLEDEGTRKHVLHLVRQALDKEFDVAG